MGETVRPMVRLPLVGLGLSTVVSQLCLWVCLESQKNVVTESPRSLESCRMPWGWCSRV